MEEECPELAALLECTPPAGLAACRSFPPRPGPCSTSPSRAEPRGLYRITHRTTYGYDDEVGESFGRTHLLPRDRPGQTCLDAQVTVTPRPTELREHADWFGNRATYFAVTRAPPGAVGAGREHRGCRRAARARVDAAVGRRARPAPRRHRAAAAGRPGVRAAVAAAAGARRGRRLRPAVVPGRA